MRRLFRIAVAVGVMAAAAAIYAGVAVGHDGGRQGGDGHGGGLLRTSLAPSVPSDPAFHGVAAGNVPWVLDRGEARLDRGGRFELRLRGLAIPNPPGDGPPGAVTSVSASFYCGPDSNAVAADTTPAVPLSKSGDATIRNDGFTVPSTCLVPVVLVHPNGNAARYIALSGWRP